LASPDRQGGESDGTPDARNIYYNYPTTGDGAVLARLVHIAAAKNPARKPGSGDKFYVTGIQTALARSMERCNGRFRSNRARRRPFISSFVLAPARGEFAVHGPG
jgi:hypothetical protein